ncbi:MAG: hypothetical protein WKG07_20390 [Hymenobacter sp.]
MTANPAWYAVQSLPYLMEYPYECSEQVFSRLYANLVGCPNPASPTPASKPCWPSGQRQAQNGTAAQRKRPRKQAGPKPGAEKPAAAGNPLGARRPEAKPSAWPASPPCLTSRAAAHRNRPRPGQAPGHAGPERRVPVVREDARRPLPHPAHRGRLRQVEASWAPSTPATDAAARPCCKQRPALPRRRYCPTTTPSCAARKAVKLADNHLDDLQIQALYARSFWPGQPVAIGRRRPAYCLLPRAGRPVLARARALPAGPGGPGLVPGQQSGPGDPGNPAGAGRKRPALARAGHVLEGSARRLLLARGPHRNPGHAHRGLRRSEKRPESGG